MQQPHNSAQAQSDVIASAILAKAVIRTEKRTVIVVVFEKSTRLEFYWLFTAKSPKSPRRSWKPLGSNWRENYHWQDFGSFVKHYALLNAGAVLFQRVIKRKALKSMLTAKLLDTYRAPVATTPAPGTYSTRKVEERYRRQSQRAVWNWR